MRRESELIASAITSGRPSFQLQLGWPSSYGALLSSEYSEVTSENALLDRAIEGGRALVAAEAGSGKTWLLARLMQKALEGRSAIPALIQLRNLPIDDPSTTGEGPDNVIRNLLDISTPDLRPALALPDAAVPLLVLIVDGLNEIPRRAAEPIIAAADELARRFPFLSVIVADRLVRRSVDLARWSLATVLPLSDDEVRRVWDEVTPKRTLPSDIGLLSRPFFLNTALEADITGSTEAETIGNYFSTVVQTTAEQLTRLSDVAYLAYETYSGRTMPEEFFVGTLGKAFCIQLEESDAIRASNGKVWFTHHLLHDFLAARSLTRREEIWGPVAFDTITFTAASFDSLRLIVEQLEDVGQADKIVRLIYDWNYYGAAYALVEGYVSEETRIVMLAMLADKRWDIIRATVVQVMDALRLDGSSLAERFLSVNDRRDVFDAVREVKSGQRWYQEWVTLFTTPDNSPASGDLVEGLRSRDSVTSWTLANVLRRCLIKPEGVERLLSISEDPSAVVRWRAVHVLGSVTNQLALQALLRRLEQDSDRWVRYGSVRSIVELAARAPDDALRTTALSILMGQLQKPRLDDSVRRELARTLDVVPQPRRWASGVIPLIQQLVGLSGSLTEQERWGQLMTAIASRSDESLWTR